MHAISAHLDPSYTSGRSRLVLARIRRRIDELNLPTILKGDFNFAHTDEFRYDTTGSVEISPDVAPARHFEDTFSDFAEIQQPLYTGRQKKEDKIAGMARGGHIYINMWPGEVLDLRPAASVDGLTTTPGLESNHVPVIARFQRPHLRAIACLRPLRCCERQVVARLTLPMLTSRGSSTFPRSPTTASTSTTTSST